MGLAVVFEALLGSEPANSWSQPTPLPSPLSSTHTCPSVERVGIPKHATASQAFPLPGTWCQLKHCLLPDTFPGNLSR